ncbi:metallopeptidase [Sulfurisphaera ohwakuensis]|uniref:Metallopeptidase n=2 Tax=Sulfurisphaera ohwakuensis TaxID=69656 RepID=A0A650CGI9_SULOH|nr:metallopeptidase [Sulfurisphaera ohwakuensis]
MKGGINIMKFQYADDVKELAKIVNEKFDLKLNLERIAFIRSQGSRSKAIARTLMLPSQWRFILSPSILYIVEVISEKYDNLTCEEKVYVILHELTHIPNSMKGGLRNHNHPHFRKIKKPPYKELKEICKHI